MGPIDPATMARLFVGFVDIVLIKGTVVVGLAGLTCYLLRRSSASTRDGVWAAAFVVLLAVPVLPVIRRPVEVTLIGVRVASVGASGIDEVRAAPMGGVHPAVAVPTPSRGGASVEPRRPTVTTVGVAQSYRWIVAIWLVGLVFQFARFGLHLRAGRRLRQRAEPCPDRVQRRARLAADDLGLRRHPVTIISPDLTVPSTCGVLRPLVLLPQAARGWPTDQLDAALLHELSHLRRRDYVTHLIAAVVKAGYWINPAVWYAGRRLEVERERACDDGVIGRVDPIQYAECLVSLAGGGRAAAQPMLSLVSRSSLGERVRSLLDRAQARTPLGRGSRLAIGSVAVLALLTAGAIEIFGVAPSEQGSALVDPDPIVRRRAAWAIGESENSAHLGQLVQGLTDPDPRVRAVLAWALGEIKAPSAIEPLVGLLGDADPRVREMAGLAIGEIEDVAGLPILREAGPAVLSDKARQWAIAQIEHQAGAPEVFTGSLTNPAAQATELPRYVEELLDGDPHVRATAAERLGRIGDVRAVEPLLDALEDRHPAVRAAAVWALDEINPSAGSVDPTDQS